MNEDRTLYALLRDGSEVVRYDKAGEWHYERIPGKNSRKVRLMEAVALAMTPDTTVFLNRPGGQMFDKRLRQQREMAQVSPNAGTPIVGNPSGTMIGGTSVEFYANNDTPDGSKFPATLATKGSVGTSNWVSQAFPAGTQFSAFTLPKYTWTYTASDGEKWVDSIGPGSDGKDAASGDITGVPAS